MKIAGKVIGYVGAGLAGALAGFIAGALSRQPEINELKEQVRSLHIELGRLHSLIEVQNHQIRELKIKYEAIKGWQFVQKNQQQGYIRGSLMYQYALMEYLKILIYADQSGNANLNKDAIKFYNAFGKILNIGEITDKDRNVVFEYISKMYRAEINELREPNFSPIYAYLM